MGKFIRRIGRFEDESRIVKVYYKIHEKEVAENGYTGHEPDFDTEYGVLDDCLDTTDEGIIAYLEDRYHMELEEFYNENGEAYGSDMPGWSIEGMMQIDGTLKHTIVEMLPVDRSKVLAYLLSNYGKGNKDSDEDDLEVDGDYRWYYSGHPEWCTHWVISAKKPSDVAPEDYLETENGRRRVTWADFDACLGRYVDGQLQIYVNGDGFAYHWYQSPYTTDEAIAMHDLAVELATKGDLANLGKHVRERGM